MAGLDAWIGGLFDDDHLDATPGLAAASQAIPDNDRARVLDLRRQLKECDAKARQVPGASRTRQRHDHRRHLDGRGRARAKDPRTGTVPQAHPTETHRQRSESARRPTPRCLPTSDPLTSGQSTRNSVSNSPATRRAGTRRSWGTPCTRGSCRRTDTDANYTGCAADKVILDRSLIPFESRHRLLGHA